MTRFVAGKGVQYALVLLFAVTLNFALPRMMPGSPLIFLAGEDVGFMTEQQRGQLLQAFGLDQPVWRQYVIYLRNLVTGNLGFSYQQGRPIASIIADRLPWTLVLVGTGYLFWRWSSSLALRNSASSCLTSSESFRRNSLTCVAMSLFMSASRSSSSTSTTPNLTRRVWSWENAGVGAIASHAPMMQAAKRKAMDENTMLMT